MSTTTREIELARAEVGFDSVHGPIEHAAERWSNAVAARFGEQSLSYAEFNRRANRLARQLRALGVRDDVCVGVLMERSLDLPVAMVAILKAGGAFVPLDPSYPEERLAFMLADTAAPVVLTQSWLRERIPADGRTIECVCVDAAWEALTELATTNLDIDVTAEQLAYIIYTSGSTGRPKGVEVLHRGLANHTAWLRDTLGMGPDDRILQCNSISFDGTLVEFFGPLQSGATVVLAAPNRQLDMPYLADLIVQEQVTVLNCVPTLLRGLLAQPALVAGRVRYVACGGEAMTTELARRLRAVVPGVRLGNFYGPTETTLNATYFEVPAEPTPDGMVPIGRPIRNVWCEVLDDDRHSVPPGVIGELYLGGPGVARGYRNQPGLTAERFIDHPSRPVRMYRTGDRVLQREDGQLHFVGRTDTQVKVRGYRIELSEVETALAAIEGVAECAVVLREDAPGQPRLVAYASGQHPTADALRESLRQRLPSHMMPAAFVLLQNLPLLTSGKIDRNRLPEPSREFITERAFVAPRGELEQQLAGIWRSLLGLERVGRDDSFFELGGDSLTAMRTVARIEALTGVRLTLRQLVSGSLGTLAEHVVEKLPASRGVGFLTAPGRAATAPERTPEIGTCGCGDLFAGGSDASLTA
jgi:amino acid adenylation domain-containing protein